MKQVFLSGKGEVEVLEVPIPGCLPKSLLVQNAFSVISTGTEGMAVPRYGGWLGVLDKALRSPERVQKVWAMVRDQGIQTAWERVRHKLGECRALGYSSAGQVVELTDEGLPFRRGDLVACMGVGFATHSEYVAVPANLAVKVPPGVDCRDAAFGALGCIAMEGIRRLELTPGEWVGVVGLGLIGQIAVQLLVAMGYRTVGIDLLPGRAARAKQLAGIEAWSLAEADSRRKVADLTQGCGLDGVIVCAATRSDEPVNLAFELCRKRGRVSLIGDVGLQLDRAKMYQREVELRMSCSYGPGRYDDEYEVHSRDYPFAYVRWTERRNLEYFLQLLQSQRLTLAPLASVRLPVEQAAEAYASINRGDENTYAAVMEYGPFADESPSLPGGAFTRRRSAASLPSDGGRVRLGVIGCGSFTRAVHLPNLSRLGVLFDIVGIASRTGSTAEVVGRRVGARISTSDHRALLDDPSIEAVLIATRHATHGALVLDALEAGKHVFVEKPLCLTVEEGKQIVAKAEDTGLTVRVGFNRRFSPHLNALREVVGTGGTRILFCRVNVGPIENDWSTAAEEGGRLLGEGVHFLDLCNWFMGSEPVALSAAAAGQLAPTVPNVTVHIRYTDGCLGQILFTTLGHPDGGKEYFEAYGNGRMAICDNYKGLRAYGARVRSQRKAAGDKGHLAELEEFASAVRRRSHPMEGAGPQAGLLATWMAHAVSQSIREKTERDLPESGKP